MKLSIIIPAYNSGQKIIKLINKLKKISLHGITKEIIVVDDCSTDNTYQILKNTAGIILIHHKINIGKGGAVRSGLEKATGDILCIQDDDLEYDPLEIPRLLKPILEGKTKVVFGSRRLNKSNQYSSFLYYVGGVMIDSFISFVLQTKLTDAITGAKVFTREVYNKIRPIETNGFDIEAEITVKAVRAGFKPFEIPISYNPRTHKEGKNIRWHHALPILKALFKYSFKNKLRNKKS